MTWVELSSDGTRLVTVAGDARARVWTTDGRAVAISPLVDHSLLNAARFDRAARRVVTAGIDGTARVWDLERDAFTATLRGHQNFLFDTAFSPDGARIASSSFDRTVKLWDAATGKLLASLDAGLVTALELGDDRLVTGTIDGRVTMWDVSTTPGAARALRGWLSCNVPLVLESGGLVAAPPRC